MHAVEALEGGRRVGHYEIVEKLGQGGWGAVYKARDTRLDRLVALKVLSATRLADEKHRRRFMQEARSASALNHPNIVTIYDIVSAGSEYYIAMEYIEGQTPREMAERIPDVPSMIPLFRQIACSPTGAPGPVPPVGTTGSGELLAPASPVGRCLGRTGHPRGGRRQIHRRPRFATGIRCAEIT
jgi:serine/threonine protein kinase